MIIGTAGHIDHGKTSLVKILTGIDTDRLPEEKKRGITIDLGFAYTQIDGGETIGFVDVPGHEKFVHTMVAGAIGIDYGLLVIAADDGIMPQTIEHLRILELLAVSQISVVITKIDMVDTQRLEEVHLEILQFLSLTNYPNAEIFSVSNVSKDGIDDLKKHIFNLQEHKRSTFCSFRLAVDRVFIAKGMGVTITGAVNAGQIGIGDMALVMPEALPVKVRSIHAQNKSVEQAHIGNRCGIVLSGVEVGQIRRGQWLVGTNLTQQVDRFDAWLQMPMDAHQRIRDGEILLLHHGTDYTSVRTILLNQKEVLPGQNAYVQLVLQKKLSICWNDRFILRDMSARFSLAGGTVLDIAPIERGRKTTARLEFLSKLNDSNPKHVFQAIIVQSKVPVSLDLWSRSMNLAKDELKKWAIEINAYEIVRGSEMYYLDRTYLSLIENVILEKFKSNEQLESIDKLQSVVRPRIEREQFRIILAELVKLKKLFLIGSKYAISNQGIVFNPQEKVIWDKAILILQREQFNPSPIRNIAQELSIAEALLSNIFKKALHQELLIDVGNHIYYPYQTMSKLAQCAQAVFEEKQQITVIDFKNAIAIGRNRTIQIIETFDKMGFTHRLIKKNPKNGEVIDYRIIKNKAVFSGK